MSDISTDLLRNEISAILKTADLSVITGRKVREQVEKKLNISLSNRKKEVDSIVMELIKQVQDQDAGSDGTASSAGGSDAGENDSDQSDDNDSSSDEDYDMKGSGGAGKKRAQAAQRKMVPKKKRKSINAQDTASESDAGSDSDYEVPKKQAAAAAAKKKPSANSGGGGGGGRKSTGFTRAYNLSPELSALMGADALPRHEVVKKVWAIIKERNLYDPKNKQFAICDDELLKIMKVKRFRTFGMLKHLKPHFLN